MKDVKIIQTSPQRTGSTLLSNLISGFTINTNIPKTARYNSKTIPKDLIEKNLIIKSHDTNIDSWINCHKEYKLYFICSERNNKIINDKYKAYPNVLCINYKEILETKCLDLNTIINNLYIKIRNFLPSKIEMNKENGLCRIIKMNAFYESIKNKNFKYQDDFYGIHGNHRDRTEYKIPFIIHQSWKSDDITTYADGKTGVISQSKWKKLYPDFDYMFWSDADIKTYINSQSDDIINTFNELNQNIKKMDFFRYLILYEYGGIYSDMDFIPNKKIPRNIFENDFVGYKACRDHKEHYLKYSDKSYTINDNDGKWVLGQAFFMCKKEYIGIKLIIDDIIKNRNSKIPPLNHTGPEKIHKLFVNANLFNNNNNIKIFSKKEMNNNKGIYGFHLRKHQW